MKTLFSILFLSFTILTTAQNDGCNNLGAWLWYIDNTGFSTHAELADTLQSVGAKRIYLKVADGTINPTIWPELLDTNLVNAYHARGLSCWAWSYNYPTSNDSLQALALYRAAQTGYDGFVIDVEAEFDGDSSNLHDMFAAFETAKNLAIVAGYIDTTFKIYCTTWGNPADHDFRIDVIDPFVDGYMPQTYVEIWGQSYVNNLAYWIQVGNEEYASLGATKPIHHLCALESGGMTSAQIDTFFMTAGGESSLWRVPGGSVSQSLWNTWRQINWHHDFCAPSNTTIVGQHSLIVYPNPITDVCTIELAKPTRLHITNLMGQTIWRGMLPVGTHQFDATSWQSGIYFIQTDNNKSYKLLKM